MKGLTWLATLAAATGIGVAGGAAYLFNRTVVRKEDSGTGPDMDTGTDWEPFLKMIGERKDWLVGHGLEQVSVRAHDGLRLFGRYFPAEHQPAKRLVLCAHGFMSQGLNDYSALSPFYHEMGYDMLIVDLRAHGASDGKYIGFGVLDRYDCLKWLEYIAERFGAQREVVLHGISMGASTVLMACGLGLPSSVKAVVADCGFTSPWDVFKSVLARSYHLPAFPILNLASSICEREAGYRFDACSTLVAMEKNTVPTLFIHGAQDTFVPTWMGQTAYAACRAKKDLLVVEKANHAASYYLNPQRYEGAIYRFLAEATND